MYNKLFTKILDSSIWLESMPTRIVWLTFIAAMDEHGFCQFASVANVAHRARVSLPEADEAIRCLEGADPNSSDPDNEGRRLERVPGGWMVLNSEKHRHMVTRAIIQEQTRQRVKRHREKVKRNSNAPVTPSEAIAEARSEAEATTEEHKPPDALRARFERWWECYPRKIGKGAAQKLWSKLRPSEELTASMIEAVEAQARSPQWTKDGGQYIPHARTWLSQERWTDERPESPAERESRIALAAAEAEFQKWKAQGHPAYTPFATFQEFRERRRA